MIGSGFGGSVSAMRLAEKGYSVLVLEEGKWFNDEDFKKTNNNLFKFFWFPKIFFRGFQRINFFKYVAILSAAGVGGGSINYANTLLTPKDECFKSGDFPKGLDWKKELRDYYELGSRMLGKVENPLRTAMDDAMKEAAGKMGVGDSSYPVDIGVFLGEPDVTVPDPYFGGRGPERTGCNECAGCMIGCRNGGKNVLLKNYLYFAQEFGAEIKAESKVVDIIREDESYRVKTAKSTSVIPRRNKEYRAKNIVLAAGVLGSLKLLFKLKRKNRLNISDKLGYSVRSNSESLIGVRKFGRKVNLSEGVAITTGIHLNDTTHVECVRYPKGANAMSIISTLLTDKRKGIYRPLLMAWNIIKHPVRMLRMLNPVGWAKQSIILLVMQTEDNRIRMVGKKKLSGETRLKTRLEDGAEKVPVYIPEANEFARKLGKTVDGVPLSCVYEVFFDTPLTAHILGGAIISNSSDEGVIDKNHRLYGYDDFYICDASTIPANLGVNPALTILAMSERAMNKIPPKDKERFRQNRLNI